MTRVFMPRNVRTNSRSASATRLSDSRPQFTTRHTPQSAVSGVQPGPTSAPRSILERVSVFPPSVESKVPIQADSRSKPTQTDGPKLSQHVTGSNEPRFGENLSNTLRRNLENASGMSLSHVKVFRNSPEPARIGARAYTQQDQIRLGPGQDGSLPHEAWHVVQQAQGRVSSGLETGPTVVRDPDMESEADSVGNLANPPILRLPEPDAAALGCRFPVADSQVIQGCLQTTKTTMAMTITTINSL